MSHRPLRTVAHLAALALAAAIVAAPTRASAGPLDVVIEANGHVSSPGVTDDPTNCLGPLSDVPSNVRLTNGDTPETVSLKVTLTPGVSFVPGSCVASVGLCTLVDPTHLTWSGMLAANQEASVSFLTQIAANVPVGTRLCATFEATFGTDTPITLTACLITNSNHQCGVAAPALGRSGEAVLAMLLLLAGAVFVRRRQS